MKLHLVSCLILLSVCLSAQAQDQTSAQTPPGPDNGVIQQLLLRIDRLEKRVVELESQAANSSKPAPGAATGAEAAGAEAAAAPAGAPQLPMMEHGGTTAETAREYPNLHLQGFGDVEFVASDGHLSTGPQALSHNTFLLGQVVLHLASALSDRVNVFSEISFTGTSSDPVAVRIERALIRFDQSDAFKISFGRYHTPINYWNSTYHHGSWLQTSITRPQEIVFGGGALPLHFVGVQAEGNLPARGLNFHYDAGIGNGRGSSATAVGNLDVNNHRAWFVNAYVRPNRLGRLRLGGSIYRDKLTMLDSPDYREWISSANIVLERETPEIIAEFANIHHRPVLSSTTFNTQVMYAQIAYRLPWGQKLWKPYYRFERIHVPEGDLAFAGVPDIAGFEGSVVGVRYDVSSYAAFKAEYGREQHHLKPDANRIALQTAFTF
jgi:hypothetical protein